MSDRFLFYLLSIYTSQTSSFSNLGHEIFAAQNFDAGLMLAKVLHQTFYNSTSVTRCSKEKAISVL